MPPRKPQSKKAEAKRESDAQLRRTAYARRIAALPDGPMTCTAPCNAPLVLSGAWRQAEAGRWLDAVDDRIRQQQPKKPGPKPPHADRYPEWASRFEAGEPITGIIRAEFPELDDEGVEKVRKSFEHNLRTQQGDIPRT